MKIKCINEKKLLKEYPAMTKILKELIKSKIEYYQEHPFSRETYDFFIEPIKEFAMFVNEDFEEKGEKKEKKTKEMSEEEIKRDAKKILPKIITVLKKYMDLEEDHYLLIAIWIIGTYFHQSFRSFPYLFFNAMKGSGKSRMLSLVTLLSKNGIVLNSLTEAVLFRTTGTLGIDEFEGVGRKGNENLKELLNSAYKKTGKVYRMKKVSGKDGETQEVEEFDVYRPIIMANIKGMDETLGDRCISLILEKSVNKKIVKLVEDFEDNVQIKDIVHQISKGIGHCGHSDTLFRIQQKWNEYVIQNDSNQANNAHKTDIAHNVQVVHNVQLYNKINNIDLLGRDLELFLPLFLISNFCGKLDEMLKISVKIVKESKEKDVYESFDVQVYDFISQHTNTGFIRCSDLTAQFRAFCGIEEKQETWVNTKWFGQSLRRLKLIKDRRRSNGTLVVLDIEKAKEKIKIFKEPEIQTEVVKIK